MNTTQSLIRPNPIGKRGAVRPMVEPPTIDRHRVEALVQLALRGLEQMYDSQKEVLFTRRFDRTDERDYHLSLRYTVMSSLGIGDAIGAGFKTSLNPNRLLESGFTQFVGEDIDHLAMALWANALLDAGLEQDIFPRLMKQVNNTTLFEGQIGRVQAWALTGLTLHAEKATGRDRQEAKEAACKIRDIAIYNRWCAESGLFRHKGGFSLLQPLFSTQIYWIYALSAFGRVFDDPEAVKVAECAADTLIRLRDPFHGWPWRYHAQTGRVAERYPVYSVHQDAMAPMALFELARASGRAVGQVNRESLSWLWRNELDIDMVDESKKVIYRAIRRAVPFNHVFENLGRSVAVSNLPSGLVNTPWFVELNATSRPYHLGWLLHAWAGRLDSVEGD